MLRRGQGTGIDGQGQDRHAGDLLEHNGVVYGLRGILAPGEGAVAGAEHTGYIQRIDAAGFERLDDDLAGVLLVILVDFLRRQLPRAGDRAVKVIGVGGAEGGQVAPRLGKGYRVGRVGVHDAAQLREGPVQLEMRFGVAAGVQIALDLVAVQVHNNEHSGRQFVIFHAGRLDDKQPLFAVNARNIAPGVGHKPAAGQLHIGLVDLLLEFFQHSVPFLCPALPDFGYYLYYSRHCGNFPDLFWKKQNNPAEAIASAGLLLNGAADEARTRYLHLGKVALYQMSYGRIKNHRR